MSNWSDFLKAIEEVSKKFCKLLETDGKLKALATSGTIIEPVTFGISSYGNDNTLLITITDGNVKATTGSSESASFMLTALPEQWEQFFKPVPVPGCQSFWAFHAVNTLQTKIDFQGDQVAFAQWSHVWRRVLELVREAYCGPMQEEELAQPASDFLTGKYVTLETREWGKSKLFYECSGDGKQALILLHTAGSDNRQNHGVMNDATMRKRCTMYAFDMPGHGRSFPSSEHIPGAYTLSEDKYVAIIAAFVKALGLRRPIICGASMAGQVCLAAAIRYKEIGAAGVIPCQAAENINLPRSWVDQSPFINQSLLNPEYVYGLIAPTAPRRNKELIWHTYSAQAYGLLHGDLDFFFGGFDGRSRVASIDTQICPVYMLAGEYDWLNTPQMSQQTADKIPGAKHKVMSGLGHFPIAENPAKFVPYLVEAIDHIQQVRSAHLSTMRLGDGTD